MAEIVAKEGIPVDQIYKISERHTWALDFYNRAPVGITSLEDLRTMRDVWVYASEEEMSLLLKSDFTWDREYVVDQFRITRLQGKFLNPNTRQNVLNKMYLLHKP